MRITESTVAMVGQHSFSQRTKLFESTRLWGKEGTIEPKDDLSWVEQKGDRLELSKEARKLLKTMGEKKEKKVAEEAEVDETKASDGETNLFELSEIDKRKIRLIEQFLSALTGKKVKLEVMDKEQIPEQTPLDTQHLPDQKGSAKQARSRREGWGFEYHRTETYYESEQLSFAAKGQVKTTDGQTIDFDVQLNMSREFMSSSSFILKAGDALIDPLVINYAGPAAELTENKYEFDINADGILENISFLQPGSGFLALDLNGDGAINDGSELFGPQSGDGFAELAAYDKDGNGWIDEGDAVYEQLRLWSKDLEGNDILTTLREADVGAIFLGNAEAEFGMKNQANQLLGQNHKAGVYLKESGGAGVVQQIDLAV